MYLNLYIFSHLHRAFRAYDKDENGLFQIWDNFESNYVDYLSYDKKSDKDTIEFNFWIKQNSNTNERYTAPNIKSFLERLASARNYDIIYLN